MSETIDSENFDPYHKWLAIPPKDQPPNHYRLLAIEPFEADRDVISHATDQRMAHLKSFQSGPYSKLSQKLLNEIAAARACLLNSDQKNQYDAALRGGLLDVVGEVEHDETVDAVAVSVPAAAPRIRPSSAAGSGTSNIPIDTGSGARRGSVPETKPKKPRKANAKRDFKINVIGHIIAPIAGLLLGWIVLKMVAPNISLFGSSDNGGEVAGTDEGIDDNVDGSVDGVVDGGAVDATDETDGSVDGRSDSSPHGTTDAAADGSPSSDGSTPSSDGVTDGKADGASDGATTSGPATVDGSDPASDGATDGATDGTGPPPDTRTPEERQIAALEEQRDSAVASGDVQKALKAIGELAALKKEDEIASQIKALGSYRAKAKSPGDIKTIVEATLMMIDAAVAADRMAEANKLATAALGDARRSNDQTLINRTTLKFIELKSKGGD